MTAAFGPPSGAGDLAAQTSSTPYFTVTVADEEFEVIMPPARALHSFSLLISGENSRQTISFIQTHVSPASYERIMLRMLDPGDSMNLTHIHILLKAIVTAGTARPYKAVAALAASTVQNWRTIRARLIRAGIADPLAQLPDMHAILDVTEDLISEGKTSAELDKFQFTLYRPDPEEKPKNFTPEEQMDAFAAFEAAVGGTS